jgi:hypothetical protein
MLAGIQFQDSRMGLTRGATDAMAPDKHAISLMIKTPPTSVYPHARQGVLGERR